MGKMFTLTRLYLKIQVSSGLYLKTDINCFLFVCSENVFLHLADLHSRSHSFGEQMDNVLVYRFLESSS